MSRIVSCILLSLGWLLPQASVAGPEMSRYGFRRTLILATTVFAILGVLAGPARADIVIFTGANNLGTDNVLLDPATDVFTATGTVGGLTVNFTSSSGSGLLTANPSGQQTVSGGVGNSNLIELTFGLANSGTFTGAVFNINAATSGSVVIHVDGINISGGFFEDDFTVDAAAQNFFTVAAINGQLIESIDLTGINGAVFTDVRQFRIGGSHVDSSVPEPNSLLLLVFGLIGMAAGLRKRFRQ